MMTRTNEHRQMMQASRKTARTAALAMVGSACFHDGEHGKIIAADLTTYAEPMVRVQFGARVATLKPSEVGSK